MPTRITLFIESENGKGPQKLFETEDLGNAMRLQKFVLGHKELSSFDSSDQLKALLGESNAQVIIRVVPTRPERIEIAKIVDSTRVVCLLGGQHVLWSRPLPVLSEPLLLQIGEFCVLIKAEPV